MSERAFTPVERDFLSRFFTGTGTLSNIYAAKAHLYPQTWAFLAGAYSRSTKTMREKLLDTVWELVLQDVPTPEGAEPEDSEVRPLYEAALSSVASASGAAMDGLLTRAEKFLEKWAVEYGHSSLKDSCFDRFAVEDVSIRSTKYLERFTLGAYQEKSTRYVDFSTVVPLLHVFAGAEIDGAPAGDYMGVLNTKAMALYADIRDRAVAHYMEQHTTLPPAVAKRTANASAFDVARYVLPVFLPTSLGITMPSRETERMLQYLLGHKHEELRFIGLGLHQSAMTTNSALVKHIKAKPARDFSTASSRFVSLFEHCDSAALRGHVTYRDGNVRLHTAETTSAAHPRWQSAAALASARDCVFFDNFTLAGSIQVHVHDHGGSVVQDLWSDAFEGVGPHDDFPEELESVPLYFEGIIDFGAYRDLQRHRKGYQPDVDMSVNLGYSTPDLLTEPGFEDLLERYQDLMMEFVDAKGSISGEQADYANCLGHNVHFKYNCSLRQALYMIRLRTAPAGHESYRSFMQSLAKALISAIPELSSVISVDWSMKTDRAASELRTQRKLASLNQSKD